MSDIFSKRFSTAPALPADQAESSAWRRALTLPSLPESHRSIPIAHNAHWFRKVLAFAGPGYLVAVGYMDPGNWATDIGGGSKFGYTLLSVVLMSNILAMSLQGRGFRLIEAFVITLIASIGLCFAYEIFFAHPIWREAARGFIPRAEILRNKEMLYIAIGILGATVMPHNLYLHSSIVQTRAFGQKKSEKREALRYATIDSTVALFFALFINAAILVLGAAAFHTRGLGEVADIAQAYKLLSPVLGAGLASTLFACALLASGQNSTLTGTLAGQVVMEGFLDIRLKPWLRRLITRSIAIIPAALVIGFAGENKVTALLMLSQVILIFQLPLAVIPLIRFTVVRSRMGEFVNSRFTTVVAWVVAAAILFFNGELVWLIFRSS